MRNYGQTDLTKLIVALRGFANDIASEVIQPVKRFSFSLGNSTEQQRNRPLTLLISVHPIRPCYKNKIVAVGVVYASKMWRNGSRSSHVFVQPDAWAAVC
jgi:hypothetical protein